MTRKLCTLACITALLSSLTPQIAYAASCAATGYTVEYINGISDTREQAQENTKILQELLTFQYKGEPLLVHLAYNEEHIGGVGGLVQAVSQALFAPLSTYNLGTLLRQIAVDDTTRKLLLVGHSQGALYANSIYEYVTEHGEKPRSVGIYAVATPASYVAGGGAYGTSYDDAVIMVSRFAAQAVDAPAPLPSNLLVRKGDTFIDPINTHRFSTYVYGAGEEILYVVGQELDALQGEPSSKTSGCFTPPEVTFFDTVEKSILGVVDPGAHAIQEKVFLVYDTTERALTAAAGMVHGGMGAVGKLAGLFGNVLSNPEINSAVPENYEKNFQIMKSLYGSSLNKQDYEELNGTQGGAVALAIAPVKKEKIVIAVPAVVAAVATTNQDIPQPMSLPVLEPKKIAILPVKPQEIVMPKPGGSSIPSYVPPAPQAIVADEHASVSTTPPVPPPDPANASTTPPVPPDQSDATTTSPVPPPPAPHQISPIHDTFDTFNSLGWQAITHPFGIHKLFDFDDGSDGSCFQGACIVGNDPALGYIDISPIMAVQVGPAQDSGAYTIYAKAKEGFNSPSPIFTICQAGFDICNDRTNIEGISFFNVIAVDGFWHQYYFAWRQGEGAVERCSLEDDIDPAHCTWVASEIAAGAQFDGVVLWSAHGYRNDLGANLWFDELEAR